MIWRVILLWWLGTSVSLAYSDTQAWDARGRLHAITERDATNSGYNWTAVYDPLGRRLSTTAVLVTNGYAFTAQSNTINQYYDPQADCLELGVTYGTKTIWKLYGPDLNGVYGGLNGQGGFDGFTTTLGQFNPTICDFRGNVLGYVTNGAVMWNPARPTAYGAVPGYRPVALGNGATVAQSSAFGGRWPDSTEYYNFHRRIYDPLAMHWLSGDPSWNDRDPNWYTYCGGDPLNHTDPNGKCVENTVPAIQLDINPTFTSFYTSLDSTPTEDAFDQAMAVAQSVIDAPANVSKALGGPPWTAAAFMMFLQPQAGIAELLEADATDTAATISTEVTVNPVADPLAGASPTPAAAETTAGGGDQTFQILDGVRRATAANLNGATTIQAEILDANMVSQGVQQVPINSLLSPYETINLNGSGLTRWNNVLNGTQSGATFPPITITPGSSGIPIGNVGIGTP